MGLLGDIGGMVGGYFGAKKEKKFTKKAMQAQKDAIKAMLALQQEGMDASAGFFGQSEEQINAVGPAMRHELLAQGERGLAAQEGSALSTGMSGTSGMAGARRGVLGDVNRNLSSLEEGLAGARSRLYERRGSEVYAQYFDRANIRQRTKYDPFLENWRPGQNNQLASIAQIAGAFYGEGVGGGG